MGLTSSDDADEDRGAGWMRQVAPPRAATVQENQSAGERLPYWNHDVLRVAIA
jgi:hypothetical protein